MKRWFINHKVGEILTALWIIISTILGSCSSRGPAEQTAKNKPKEAVPVTVAVAWEKSVPVQLDAIGVVEAYSTIDVKSQIAGELTQVFFQVGQDVKKGDVLFTIDNRPYEVSSKQLEAELDKNKSELRQAEANLTKTRAQSSNSDIQAQRYKKLVESGAVSKNEYDSMRTNAEAFEADVHAGEAAIENAKNAIRSTEAAIENVKLQLNYCTIKSPIDGRTGDLAVYEGNLVKANDTPALVTIKQITPIYVSFSIPEKYLPEIKRLLAETKITAKAALSDQVTSPSIGVVTFMDNEVDRATGTIRLKATFPNSNKSLWPGQFVNVTITLSVKPNAVVVPSKAVQNGQQGFYLYVVAPDMTALLRHVKVGISTGDETVIDEGIKPGEKVVTDGQLRLSPGSPIKIKNSQVENRTSIK